MFVSELVGKEISQAFVASATVMTTGKQGVQKATPQIETHAKAKTAVKSIAKTNVKGKQTKIQFKKEVSQKKSYNEESVTKDATWNIYTGNPGIYITAGDTANFGTVTTLSDSAFLQARHAIVPKTIKPYGIVGKELIIPNQDWILGIILIFWMIFASVRVGFLKYLGQLFNI